MSQPTPQEGKHLIAHTNIQTAIMLLQHSLPTFGLGSREGKVLLDVLKKLSNDFGAPEASNKLVPAQVMEMVKAVQAQGSAQVPGSAPSTGQE